MNGEEMFSDTKQEKVVNHILGYEKTRTTEGGSGISLANIIYDGFSNFDDENSMVKDRSEKKWKDVKERGSWGGCEMDKGKEEEKKYEFQ